MTFIYEDSKNEKPAVGGGWKMMLSKVNSG